MSTKSSLILTLWYIVIFLSLKVFGIWLRWSWIHRSKLLMWLMWRSRFWRSCLLAKPRRREGPKNLEDLLMSLSLRHSKCLNDGLAGYRNVVVVAQEVEDGTATAQVEEEAVEVKVSDLVEDPAPIEVLPHDVVSSMVVYSGAAAEATYPAPHLPLETVQAMGTEFLKMHPEAVSDAALLASDDVDE
jgi:hypothetical protein